MGGVGLVVVDLGLAVGRRMKKFLLGVVGFAVGFVVVFVDVEVVAMVGLNSVGDVSSEAGSTTWGLGASCCCCCCCCASTLVACSSFSSSSSSAMQHLCPGLDLQLTTSLRQILGLLFLLLWLEGSDDGGDCASPPAPEPDLEGGGAFAGEAPPPDEGGLCCFLTFMLMMGILCLVWEDSSLCF